MGKSRRPLGIAAAIAVVVAGGGAAYAVRQNIMEQQSCDVAKARIAKTGFVSTVTTGTKSVSILGDSYTVGVGLDAGIAAAWPALAGRDLGWTTQVAAVGGTGFVNDGACGGHAFADRLGGALQEDTETLIIAGGVNDAEAGPSKAKEAADALLERVAYVPNVVVIGPANAPAVKDLPAIDQALAKAAADNGREYISALSWDLEYLPDNLHPTEAGHKAYAAHVTEALR